jgi:ABC-type sugar transport system ATPase subunit
MSMNESRMKPLAGGPAGEAVRMDGPAVLLRMKGIHKRFPGVHALKGVDLEVNRGEVHALVGENGAGKSTLMHILAGVHKPDGGVFAFDGAENVRFADEHAAQTAGIGMVYQERSLVPALSVAENIYAARQPVNRWGVIRFRTLHERAADLLRTLDMDIPPTERVDRLSPAGQQQVEIAKALSLDARLVIFDEPTTSLTGAETKRFFGAIGNLKRRGIGIVYISHRLDEIFEIADRVTVLKDGERVGTYSAAGLTTERLIGLMVGRDFLKGIQRPAAGAAGRGRALLEVRGLCDGGRVRDVSFFARAGEITALAGLNGSGRTETALAVFGAGPRVSGEILVDGKPAGLRTPQEAVRLGIGYLPEDRKEAGLFLEMGVVPNIAAAHIASASGFLADESRYGSESRSFMKSLSIAAGDPRRPVQTLSGGNQQKVLLARWLLVRPRILFVDEPTRGIDVGAKREVHLLLRNLAESGAAVILISSELQEILAVADRVVILHEGKVSGEFGHAEATEEGIMRCASIAGEPE